MKYPIQLKYLNLFAVHLDKFKQKGNEIWNCRCPYCGDSQKSKIKARGYFFKCDNTILYKCHNCEISKKLPNMIRELNKPLFDQMLIEHLQDKPNKVTRVDSDKPKWVIKSADVLQQLKCLDGTKLYDYVYEERMIPKHRIEFLLCDSLKQFDETLGFNKHSSDSQCVAILCIVNRKISAVQFRLFNSTTKYLTYNTNDYLPNMFGIDTIDESKTISLIEGPFDSTFVDNCIATLGLPNIKDVEKIKALGIDGEFRFIYDADYVSNKHVMTQIKRTINAGYDVVIYDKSFKWKDINDAIVSGVSVDEINDYLNKRTFSGMKALLELSKIG